MEKWETKEEIYTYDWQVPFKIQTQKILGWRFYRYKMINDWNKIKCFFKRKIQQG